MREIPNRIQCSYCKRSIRHGGQCGGKSRVTDEEGCLAFMFDERGCLRNNDFNLMIPLYGEIPPLNTWLDWWEIKGVPIILRIEKIKGLSWDTKSGYLKLYCGTEYFINEFHEDYKETEDKSHLKLIKGKRRD